MIAARKKKTRPAFPRAKIARLVDEILPKGRNFSLHTETSSIGDLKIVRIVTDAWKNQRGWERISKVLKAVEGRLSEAERDGILRFSVLTPKEYKEVVLNNRIRPARVKSKRKTAAKRKSAKSPNKRSAKR